MLPNIVGDALKENAAQAMVDLLGQDALHTVMAKPPEQRAAALEQVAEKTVNNLANLDQRMHQVVDYALEAAAGKGKGQGADAQRS